MNESQRERLLYPDVIAATKLGEGSDGKLPIRYFAEFTTNNMDTVIRGYVYWYTPEGEEPVLVIEIDDEDLPGGMDPMDIRIRVRRNDGLVYDSNREETKYIKEEA